MALRNATLSDQPALDRLYDRSYSTLLAPHYDADQLARALPKMTRAQPDLLQSGRFYVWEDEAGIVGAGGWSIDRDRSTKAHIRHVATDPDHLRKGIAQDIVMHALCAARTAKVEEVECWSTRAATRFYASLGFMEGAEFDVLLGGEIPFPSVRMHLML